MAEKNPVEVAVALLAVARAERAEADRSYARIGTDAWIAAQARVEAFEDVVAAFEFCGFVPGFAEVPGAFENYVAAGAAAQEEVA